MAQLSNQYTEATTALILDGVPVTDVIQGLKKSLQARNHSGLLTTVLTELKRELPSRLKENVPQVRIASPAQLEAARESIQSELNALGAPSSYDVTYDDTLIGGTVVNYRSTRIDSSYKHTLKHLYNHIITS